jgi:hypothetical protein
MTTYLFLINGDSSAKLDLEIISGVVPRVGEILEVKAAIALTGSYRVTEVYYDVTAKAKGDYRLVPCRIVAKRCD